MATTSQTEANERLESIREQAVAEAQDKEKELQDMAEQIRSMQEELQNPVLSDQSKAEKQAELQADGRGRPPQAGRVPAVAAADHGQPQPAQPGNPQHADRRDRQGRQRHRPQGLFDADLVFDTSDILGSGVPTVLYADTDLDITDKVMMKLNADAPNN
jgi:TolA-binding protein